MVAEIVVYWRGNPTNSLRQRSPVCSTSLGQPPTWCDLWRCREMITKLHSEGHPGANPQYHNWKRGVSETSRAAAAPEFLHDGHQPQNWPTLDGISLPSDKTSQTSLWNPHRGKVKGEMEVEFLPTCGAAQEKQSAAALPSSTPNALPLNFVLGFWPLAKTGAIPRTGFQVTPQDFLVSSR